MTRFNTKNQGVTKTTNKEGAVAYILSPEMELYSKVVTASLQNKFYESKDESIVTIRDLISKCDSKFVKQLAVYTREKMYLRSIPLVLSVELLKQLKENNIKDTEYNKLVSRVIQRPDEITEILSYYQIVNNAKGTKKLGKLSKQLQKGIANSFNKFDEYQLAKYNRKQDITLKDALFLSHAKPENKEQEKLFKALIDDKLEVPYTWETELSDAGKTGKDKKLVWEELIDSGKVGYMALLRNLRNIIEAGVSQEHLIKVAKTLSDEKAVKKSKQLPFRFFSAYKSLEGIADGSVSMILEALETAVIFSTENIKGYDFDTSVLVACDVSSSMEHSISPRSTVQYYDIGILLAMALQKRCKNAITGIFGDTWKVKMLPKDNILYNTNQLHSIEGEVGYSTNGYKVIQDLIAKNKKVDKIMIFTDGQMWNSSRGSYYDDEPYDSETFSNNWREYKKISPDSKLYLFDLTGYGNTPVQINGNDVFLIAGWSDKIFDILNALDDGKKSLDEIKKIEI